MLVGHDQAVFFNLSKLQNFLFFYAKVSASFVIWNNCCHYEGLCRELSTKARYGMYMVQGPIQQHESMNLCISSHMKGKIAFICNFSALGNNSSIERKIQNFDKFWNFRHFSKNHIFGCSISGFGLRWKILDHSMCNSIR